MAGQMARKTALGLRCGLPIQVVTFASCGWIWLTGLQLSTVFVVELSKMALRPETTMYDCISGESNRSPNPLS